MKNYKIILLTFILINNYEIFAKEMMDKITAIVEDDVILESDINYIIELQKQYNNNIKQKILVNKNIRKKILQQLIIDQLILKLGLELEIIIDNNQINQAINIIAHQNNITLDQLYQYLASKSVDYNTFKTKIHSEILVSEVKNNEINKHIKIWPHEIQEYVKKISKYLQNNIDYHLTHISITFPKEISNIYQINQAKSIIESIINNIKNEINIENILINNLNTEIFKINSKKISGKSKDLPNIFVKHLNKIDIGNITKPIYSPLKCDILQINKIEFNKNKIFGIEIYIKQLFLEHRTTNNNQQIHEVLLYYINKIQNGEIKFDDAAKNILKKLKYDKTKIESKWCNLEDCNPKIRNMIESIQINDINQPIYTNNGWYIIQLNDIRLVNNIKAIEKKYAYDLILNNRLYEEIQNWNKELILDSYVEIFE